MKDTDLIETFIQENGGYPDGLNEDEVKEFREAMAKTMTFAFYSSAKAAQDFGKAMELAFETMPKKQQFKSHMVFWFECGEGFSTVCGINDGASERFKEAAILVDFGDTKNTTCKKCLARFEKLIEAENNRK